MRMNSLKNMLAVWMTLIVLSTTLHAEEPKATPEIIKMIVQNLESADAETRNSAVTTVEVMGARADAAIVPIIASIRKAANPGTSVDGARALVRLGPGLLPEIEKLAQAKEIRILMPLSMAAAEYGAPAKAVLNKLAQYPSDMVSKPAKDALAKMDTSPVPDKLPEHDVAISVPPSTGGTNGPGSRPTRTPQDIPKYDPLAGVPAESRNVMDLLQRSQANPKQANPAWLITTMKDPYPPARIMALQTLMNARNFSNDVLAAFIDALKDPDKSIRFKAVVGLANAGERGLPGLLVGMENDDTPARNLSLKFIGDLESKAKSALPVLRAAKLKDKEIGAGPYDRAISQIEGKPQDYVATAIELLKTNPNSRERDEVFRKLRTMDPILLIPLGPPCREILQKSEFRTVSWPLEEDCLRILVKLGKSETPMILQLLKNPNERVYLTVRNDLMDERDNSATGILEELAAMPDEAAAQKAVLYVLSQSFGPIKVQLKLFETMLKSKENETRIAVLDMLIRRQPEDLMLLRASLAPLMNDPDEKVKKLTTILSKRFK